MNGIATAQHVRVVSIGGIGEIGKNCTVIEYGDDAIVLDCGITFPDAGMLGVDLVCRTSAICARFATSCAPL